jgi:hypothetical protein
VTPQDHLRGNGVASYTAIIRLPVLCPEVHDDFVEAQNVRDLQLKAFSIISECSEVRKYKSEQ